MTMEIFLISAAGWLATFGLVAAAAIALHPLWKELNNA